MQCACALWVIRVHAARNPATGLYYGIATTPAPVWMADRGYTGHEHIWLNGTYDNSVINMNGRLYDPLVGRMFSPDPYVADGSNSQDYNLYTYARNNPLKYTDPSGYKIGVVHHVIPPAYQKPTWKSYVGLGLAMAGLYYAPMVGLTRGKLKTIINGNLVPTR